MKWLGSLLICAMPWLHEFLYCLFLPAIQIGINDNKRGATHRLVKVSAMDRLFPTRGGIFVTLINRDLIFPKAKNEKARSETSDFESETYHFGFTSQSMVSPNLSFHKGTHQQYRISA
jgi:hypothetical protein